MPQIILQLNSDADKIHLSDNIACYMVADTLSAPKINEIISTKKMVLCYGEKSLDVCKKYNLDGVIKEIDESKPLKAQIKSLREELKKKSLGVIIPARRHEAMLAGEVEPDFICFKVDKTSHGEDVIKWYNELFLIPLAAICEFETFQTIKSEIDFMIVDSKKFENFGC